MDQSSAKLSRFLGYLGDQISIANDIASYEKEKRQFQTGKVAAMINVVHVITKVDRMDDMEAKSMAYAWQLWTENRIIRELEEMKRQDDLSLEEWRFADACLVAAAGNLLTSIVISRYGGEKARIAW